MPNQDRFMIGAYGEPRESFIGTNFNTFFIWAFHPWNYNTIYFGNDAILDNGIPNQENIDKILNPLKKIKMNGIHKVYASIGGDNTGDFKNLLKALSDPDQKNGLRKTLGWLCDTLLLDGLDLDCEENKVSSEDMKNIINFLANDFAKSKGKEITICPADYIFTEKLWIDAIKKIYSDNNRNFPLSFSCPQQYGSEIDALEWINNLSELNIQNFDPVIFTCPLYNGRSSSDSIFNQITSIDKSIKGASVYQVEEGKEKEYSEMIFNALMYLN